MAETNPSSSSSSVSVPLKGLAGGAGAVAIGSLATLALVATNKDADGLATVALELAVLSLLIQIVVYIAQAWISSQQQVRAEQLHTELLALVKLVEERTTTTKRMIDEQYNKVLEAIIPRAMEEEASGKDKIDPEDLARRVTERVRKELQRVSVVSSPTYPSNSTFPGISRYPGSSLGFEYSDAITAGSLGTNRLGELKEDPVTGKFYFDTEAPSKTDAGKADGGDSK